MHGLIKTTNILFIKIKYIYIYNIFIHKLSYRNTNTSRILEKYKNKSDTIINIYKKS